MSGYTPPTHIQVGSRLVRLDITGPMRDPDAMSGMVDAVQAELEEMVSEGKQLPESVSIRLPDAE